MNNPFSLCIRSNFERRLGKRNVAPLPRYAQFAPPSHLAPKHAQKPPVPSHTDPVQAVAAAQIGQWFSINKNEPSSRGESRPCNPSFVRRLARVSSCCRSPPDSIGVLDKLQSDDQPSRLRVDLVQPHQTLLSPSQSNLRLTRHSHRGKRRSAAGVNCHSLAGRPIARDSSW
jgi:hypothetical protein